MYKLHEQETPVFAAWRVESSLEELAGLYSFRFACIAEADASQFRNYHDNLPDKPLLSQIGEHVYEKHIVKGSATPHYEGEAHIIEEFLHHETVKDTPFFWLDNVSSYFRRLGYILIHHRRRLLLRYKRSNKIEGMNEDNCKLWAHLVSQDPTARDTFLFVVSAYDLWLHLRSLIFPIWEAVWKTTDEIEAKRYVGECKDACRMLNEITTDWDRQLEVAKRLLDIPMDWFRSFQSRVPENYWPMNRLRNVHAQALSKGFSLDSALAKLSSSPPIYKSRSIGFWYFGFLPDYLLWYYVRNVFLSSDFLVHSLKSGYLFRLIGMLVHRHHTTYGIPALVVEGEKRLSMYDPEATKGLPGFGLERIVEEDALLIYLYGFLFSIVLSRAETGHDPFESQVLRFWEYARVSHEELHIAELLHRQIEGYKELNKDISIFIKNPRVDCVADALYSVECAYWRLLRFSAQLDQGTLSSVLRRHYLHGYT